MVKLDTNGYRPQVLWSLLNENLLDYVAMDIKASRRNYARAAGVKNLDISRIEESVCILKSCRIPYEFRTTVVNGIHNIEELDAIGRWLEGCNAYYLQAFRENENIIEIYRNCSNMESDVVAEEATVRDSMFGTFTKTEMESMAEIARKYIDKVALRGVE